MKRKWLALVMAPALLSNCGSDDTQHHDWSDHAPVATNGKDAKPAKPDNNPEKKGVVTAAADSHPEAPAHNGATTAPEQMPASVSRASEVVPDQPKPPRKLGIDIVDPGWILKGVGDDANVKDWHFVIKKINRDFLVADIEEGFTVVVNHRQLQMETSAIPKPNDPEVFTAVTDPYVGSTVRFVFKRNPENGECSATYAVEGYLSNQKVIFYGKCL